MLEAHNYKDKAYTASAVLDLKSEMNVNGVLFEGTSRYRGTLYACI
jgi:hypothetical protein